MISFRTQIVYGLSSCKPFYLSLLQIVVDCFLRHEPGRNELWIDTWKHLIAIVSLVFAHPLIPTHVLDLPDLQGIPQYPSPYQSTRTNWPNPSTTMYSRRAV